MNEDFQLYLTIIFFCDINLCVAINKYNITCIGGYKNRIQDNQNKAEDTKITQFEQIGAKLKKLRFLSFYFLSLALDKF